MRTNRAELVLAAIIFGVLVGCGPKSPIRSVTLTWEPAHPENRHMIVHYNVYRSTTSGKSFVQVASKLTYPWYEDSGVSSGQTYFYAVTALDPVGHESRFSGEVEATIP